MCLWHIAIRDRDHTNSNRIGPIRHQGHPAFAWYNNEHRHSGIGLVTPAQRHSGADRIVYGERQTVLAAFYEQHPERFVRGVPTPPELPGDVWINRPEQATKAA